MCKVKIIFLCMIIYITNINKTNSININYKLVLILFIILKICNHKPELHVTSLSYTYRNYANLLSIKQKPY